MKLPTRLRYGLRFMAHLANSYTSGEMIPISQISKEEGISNKYLEQIISNLSRAQLVKGARGKGGGYVLVKDPSQITIYEIALALDEDFNFINCVRKPNSCRRKSDCPTYQVWRDFSQTTMELFKKKTLAELVTTPAN